MKVAHDMYQISGTVLADREVALDPASLRPLGPTSDLVTLRATLYDLLTQEKVPSEMAYEVLDDMITVLIRDDVVMLLFTKLDGARVLRIELA